MTKANAQIITPRDTGRRSFDLKQPLFDDGALARADEALKAMSGSFQQWLDADVERLQEARFACEAARWSDAALEALMVVAHDLKGLGATYEYPLVTEIAASLCRLIETPAGKAAARGEPALVRAHVDAIRAVARDGIKSSEHPLGRAVLRALEAQVATLGVAPR